MAALLGTLCFAVYLTPLRPPDAADSIPARLLPFSILREHDVDLDEFGWLSRGGPLPYFLRQSTDGHLVSRYPIATAVLATPVAVPALWWVRRHQIEDNDVRFRLATLVVERVAAAALTAASVSLVFLALIRLTTTRLAVSIALAYGLGSNTWATSSQALWQHGLAELSLAGLSLFLVAPDSRRNAVAAGVFAALCALARPSMAIFAALAAVYVWRERRRHFLAFAAMPAAGTILVLGYNLTTMGSPLGGYAGVGITPPRLSGLFGLLISPNRGLVVFTPAVLLSLAGFLRPRQQLSRWVAYLGPGCAAYLVLCASVKGWWGGATYGPRFLVDMLPALALSAAPVVETLARGALGLVVLGVLASCGVVVQVAGAYGDYSSWNALPEAVKPQRVWDWSDLQIVRTLRGDWDGLRLAPMLWQAATEPTAALLRQLPAKSLVGEIEVEGAEPLRYRAGTTATIAVRVTNRSDVTWPAFSDWGFLDCRLVYVWKGTPPGLASASGSLVLPRNLPPGETARLTGALPLPRQPGSYELRLVFVQLLDAEHGVYGNTSRTVKVVVDEV